MAVLKKECLKNMEEKLNHSKGRDEVVDSDNCEDEEEDEDEEGDEGGAELDYESQSDDEADESFHPEDGEEEEDEEESDNRRRRTVRRNVPGKGCVRMEDDSVEEEGVNFIDISDDNHDDGEEQREQEEDYTSYANNEMVLSDEVIYSSMEGEEDNSRDSLQHSNHSTDVLYVASSEAGTQLLQRNHGRDKNKKSEICENSKISVYSDNVTKFDNDNSESSIEQKRRKTPLQDNSLYLVGEKKKPYYYYTVSELKALLKDRKLIVAGIGKHLLIF